MTDQLTFKCSDELGKRVRDLSDSDFEGNLTHALIHMAEKYLNPENQFSFLDDNPCSLRDYLGEDEAPTKIGKGWFCMKKAPTLTKLGSGIESAADKICGKCKIKDAALQDSKILKEQQTKGIVVMIPSCKKGAEVNEDMTQMYCPQIGAWRGIKERTKKKQYPPCREAGKNKSNCEWLKHTQTVIKGKLPDGQNL